MTKYIHIVTITHFSDSKLILHLLKTYNEFNHLHTRLLKVAIQN